MSGLAGIVQALNNESASEVETSAGLREILLIIIANGQ